MSPRDWTSPNIAKRLAIGVESRAKLHKAETWDRGLSRVCGLRESHRRSRPSGVEFWCETEDSSGNDWIITEKDKNLVVMGG